MNAVQLLTAQHRDLEALMKGTLASNDAAARTSALVRVGDELAKHLASEEEVFYPAVNLRNTQDTLLESLEEHLSLKRLLADLLALDPHADTWEAKFKVLREQSEHHHKEEEEHLFPKVSTAFDAAELETLGQRMLSFQQDLQRVGDPREVVAEQTDEAAPLK